MDHVADRCFDFCRADVLAPPPESVARTVLEVEPPELVHHEDVARSEGQVASSPYILHDLLLCRVAICVASEVADGVVVNDLPDKFSGLAGPTRHAKAVGTADFLSRFLVYLDQP